MLKTNVVKHVFGTPRKFVEHVEDTFCVEENLEFNTVSRIPSACSKRLQQPQIFPCAVSGLQLKATTTRKATTTCAAEAGTLKATIARKATTTCAATAGTLKACSVGHMSPHEKYSDIAGTCLLTKMHGPHINRLWNTNLLSKICPKLTFQDFPICLQYLTFSRYVLCMSRILSGILRTRSHQLVLELCHILKMCVCEIPPCLEHVIKPSFQLFLAMSQISSGGLRERNHKLVLELSNY
jgi:hypothetical protein